MNYRCLKWTTFWALVLIAFISWGCGESRSLYAGTYRSEQPYAGKGHIELVLKENGECTWTHERNIFKFKWKAEEGRIWLYTREGGIMIGTPGNGGKKLSVDTSGDWHPSCPVDKCLVFDRVS